MSEEIKPDVFICFHPDDVNIARDLEKSLQNGFNITTNERQPGLDSHDSWIKNAIGNAEYFIYILSLAALQSNSCKAAYELAKVQRQYEGKGIRIVLVEARRDYYQIHLPPDLVSLNITPYNLSKPGSDEYASMLTRLVDDLCTASNVIMAARKLGDYADRQPDRRLKQTAARIDRMAKDIGQAISIGDITDGHAIAIGDNIRIVTEQYNLPPVLVEQLIQLTKIPEKQPPSTTSPKKPATVLSLFAIVGALMIVAVLISTLWLVIANRGPKPAAAGQSPTATPTMLPTPIMSAESREEAEPVSVETDIPQPTEIPPTMLDQKGNHQMVLVPGGSFQMGSAGYGEDESPIHAVTVSPFYMDIYEVTIEQYAAFLNDLGGNWLGDKLLLDTNDSYYLILGVGGNWEYQPEKADYPVTGVTWYGADEYCKWREGRLPTEAEWEYAARGPENLTYPWGDTPPDCQTVNYGTCGMGLIPVQRILQDKSPFGIYALGGNAFEWVGDWFQKPYNILDSDDPTGPEVGELKVLRGGSYLSTDAETRASARAASVPNNGVSTYGFRCVHPVEP